MRYLSIEEYTRLWAQGLIKQCDREFCPDCGKLHGILTIHLPEPGGAIIKEDCIAVTNPPKIGVPIPKDWKPIYA